MITGSISGLGAFDDILAELHRLQNFDPRPLTERIARILADDNAAGLRAGTTSDGRAAAPLKPSTLKHRPDGPPGAPGGGGSLVSDYRVTVEATPTGLVADAGWGGSAGPKARFYSEGTRHQVARPLDGLRPETAAKIQEALDDAARELARG